MGLLAAILTASPAYADTKPTSPVIEINEEAAKADIKTTPVRGNVSVLMGSGGNIGVLTGSDGKLLVRHRGLQAQDRGSARRSRQRAAGPDLFTRIVYDSVK